MTTLAGAPILALSLRRRVYKRALDIAASATGLVILSPLLVALACAVALDSPGGALFRQQRIGRGGKPFTMLKFRSMVANADNIGPHLTVSGDKRVTRLGALLRMSKLDELPQLINVLLGQMSLVGPRPEVPDLLHDYTEEQIAIITALRPGMTDYASLCLRDEAQLLAGAKDPAAFYRERLVPMKTELCERYLRNDGPATDLKIIFMTIKALVAPRSGQPQALEGFALPALNASEERPPNLSPRSLGP